MTKKEHKTTKKRGKKTRTRLLITYSLLLLRTRALNVSFHTVLTDFTNVHPPSLKLCPSLPIQRFLSSPLV